MIEQPSDLEPIKKPEKRTNTFQKIVRLVKKVFRIGAHPSFEESVSELIREHDKDASVHEEERAILQNIITFGDLETSDVMLPRTEIIAVPVDIKANDLQNIFLEQGHSRIPVYTSSIDNIIGFVHFKDFFRCLVKKEEFILKKLLHELIFVPKTLKVTDLLTRMKNSLAHIAIVLDEYGGTEGLVTIEDIVEEIFGEIKDEYEEAEPQDLIKPDGEALIIDARAKVEAVEKILKLTPKISSNKFDTFGGFIITHLGRIPKKGENISHPSGLDLEIIEADNRRVKLVRVIQR